MTAPLLPASAHHRGARTPHPAQAEDGGDGDDLDPRLPTQLVEHVATVVVGKRAVIELAVITLLAGGHMLVEDVPGVGKTLLARTLARAVGADDARIQGAPDLLPGDLTGSSIWRPTQERFEFVPGPLFANVVLVDEVNRMPPRTQAALLQAMQEGQVSVDGITHTLPQPHLVIATQNPLDHQGTFPLPEAQLDRFTSATSIGYPTPVHEAAVIRSQLLAEPLASMQPLIDLHQLASLQSAVRQVHVSDDLVAYAVRLVCASREQAGVRIGASPRAGLQLVRAAQALALRSGRDHALPDDVQAIAVPVLAHRIVMESGGRDAASQMLAQLLSSVPVSLP